MKKYIIALFVFLLPVSVLAQQYFNIYFSYSADTIKQLNNVVSMQEGLITGTIIMKNGMDNAILHDVSNTDMFSIDFVRINPDNNRFYIKIKEYSSRYISMRFNMIPRESVQYHEVKAQYNKNIMTISPDQEEWKNVRKGDHYIFNAIKKAGHENDSIVVTVDKPDKCGTIFVNQTNARCEIQNVQDDLTVTVTLIPTYEITIPAIADATISPTTWGRVGMGTNFVFMVNKHAGYDFNFIKVTADKPDKCGTITVDQVTGACEIPNIRDNLTVTITLTYQFLQDAELRRWIANHQKAFTDYGVKVESDGNIIFTPSNESAIAFMTSLEITGDELSQSQYNITYIDDLLGFMPGLKSLNCSGNALATLNLSENQALESLNCSGNNLTYIDISTTNVTGSLGSFMGKKQARTFVMKVTCPQYTNMRRNSVLPYPNWTEFEFINEEACNDDPNPAIYRTIRLLAYEGLDTNPALGVYNIVSGENFSFTYYVKDGYTAENIKITTGNELYDEYITIDAEDDGGFLVTIYEIRSMIEINITGVEPEIGVHNDFVTDENEPKVWTYGKTLHIYTPLATDIAIYDVKGILYKQEFIPSGQTSYSLPKGLYIVRFADNKTRKVVIY